MNYACVFLVFVLLFALVYWFISGRRFYHGPITEAVVADSASECNQTGEKDKDGQKN